jgi:DNA-binding MarR family transcriptional regulator
MGVYTRDVAREARRIDAERVARLAETCTALNLRNATRAITGLYDDAMRPAGVRISQFGLLAALAVSEEATVSKLAGVLGLDRTTMTRNLGPLLRRGLIASETGADARSRVLRLTEKGRAALVRALPLWQRAQARVVRGLGEARWKGLLQGLKATAALARSGR